MKNKILISGIIFSMLLCCSVFAATTTGSLNVVSTPAGASIYLDSVYKGVTPKTISNIPAGTHHLLLSKTGYLDYTSAVTINSRKTTKINAALTPIPQNTCSETDGGNMPAVFGTVSGYLNSVKYTYGDTCSDSINLTEYFCSGTSMQSQQVGCSLGCSKGRCNDVAPVNKKVLLLVFNPIIESSGSRRLTEVNGWNDPVALTNSYIGEIRSASRGYANYNVIETIVADEYPTITDGYQYTDDTYMQCWIDHSTCHNPQMANYNKILNDYNICSRVNSGEIQELWMFGGPWFGFWEANMAGPTAWWTNGPIITGTACSQNLQIMGFSYERGISEMLENFGHRFEGTMTNKLFGSWDMTSYANAWDRFTQNRKTHPSGAKYYQCGNVHFAPNSLADYDWTNSYTVTSNCDDWLNYPNMKGQTAPINCNAWGCSDLGYKRWWLSHLPIASGTTNGITNNWWQSVLG
jgi:hypothetical protein